MADRNLCVVADRVLGLLHSEVLVKSGFRDSDECQRVKRALISSGLTARLLDAEKKLYHFGNELGFLESLVLQRQSRNSNFMIEKVVNLFLPKTYLSHLDVDNCRGDIEYMSRELNHAIDNGLYELNLEKVDEKEIQIPPKEDAARWAIVDGWASIKEKDKRAILIILLDKNPIYEVLPIVGELETGIHMLESYVMNDRRVESYFDVNVWVSLGMEENEFARLTRQNRRNIVDLETLRRSIGESWRGKLCLIIVIVSEFSDCEKLNSIKQSLIRDAPGSRILLLTRSSLMGKNTEGVRREYRLECLSEEESWDLFKKMTYQPGEEPLPGSPLAHIGHETAKKYKECPHIIMAIGGMREDYSSQELHLLIRRIDDMYELRAKYRDINPFLKLSYYNLRSPLKHCFAYCSLFPSYYEIDVENLIKLWIASGFIMSPLRTTSSGGVDNDLEDIAYVYFLNLLKRSFFHDAKLDARGHVIKCRMHHSVHNLATMISKDHCRLLSTSLEGQSQNRSAYHFSLEYPIIDDENLLTQFIRAESPFFQSILFPTRGQKLVLDTYMHWDGILKIISTVHALDMHACGFEKVPRVNYPLYYLRYLDLSQNHDITELEEWITKSPALQTLILSSCFKLKELPRDIGDLVNLRHLLLDRCYSLTSLPCSITKLVNLQTMKLSSCLKLKELPRGIGNLVNLRHLLLDGCYSLTSMPRGFGKLTNLQTLTQLVLSDDPSKATVELEELKQLSNLRELLVKNLGHGMGENISSCLKKLQRVRSLSLEWEICEPKSEYDMVKLNGNMSSHLEELNLTGLRAINKSSFLPTVTNNLVKLSLKRVVKCRIIPSLDKCFNLKVLVVDEMADLEYINSQMFSTQVCPSLEELWLTELPNLKSWWEKTNDSRLASFPCLSRLVIEDCPNLTSMPLFPTLEEGLVLDSTSWELFKNTMNHKAAVGEHAASSSSSNSHPLCKLKNLCIVGIDDFDNSKANKIAWHTLKSLGLLKFDYLPKMTTLREGLQQVTTLQQLHIWRGGIEEIPEWIDKLELLERLVRMARFLPNDHSFPIFLYIRYMRQTSCFLMIFGANLNSYYFLIYVA